MTQLLEVQTVRFVEIRRYGLRVAWNGWKLRFLRETIGAVDFWVGVGVCTCIWDTMRWYVYIIYAFKGGHVWVWFHHKSLSVYCPPPLSFSYEPAWSISTAIPQRKELNTKHVWTLSSWTWTGMKPFSTSFGTTAVSIAFCREVTIIPTRLHGFIKMTQVGHTQVRIVACTNSFQPKLTTLDSVFGICI